MLKIQTQNSAFSVIFKSYMRKCVLYIVKKTKTYYFCNYREKPSDFLTKRLNFSMQEILYIHVGVGSQLIQFEMAADAGHFTLMTGDSITVERFANRIQGEYGYVFMNLLLLFSILLCLHFHGTLLIQ